MFNLLLLAVVALGVGFGLSYYALTDGRLFGVVQIGPWTAWPDIGAGTPNPYTRGHIARTAALQLGQAEGLQLLATTDSAGEPLDRACGYRLSGTTPLASFWTLVALDAAGENIATPEGSLAFRSSELVRQGDGSFVLHVGTALRPRNWLELTGAGPFTLALTLYDSAVLSGFNPAQEPMPTIEREGCA